MQFCAANAVKGVEAEHCVRLDLGCGTYFFRPSVEIQHRGVGTTSLADSFTVATIAAPVPLARVGLLLRVPLER